jgi:hypothetical protein
MATCLQDLVMPLIIPMLTALWNVVVKMV